MFYSGASGSGAALHQPAPAGQRLCRIRPVGRAEICSAKEAECRAQSQRDSDRSQIGMAKNILITGGAGFVGSHLVDALLAAGHNVRILDNLVPQVHGDQLPGYLPAEAELIRGDMQDAGAVYGALQGVEVVFHLAAVVGVGQSMYEISHY